MGNDPLWIALIGLGMASLSSLVPLLTVIVTYKQKRADRLEDYARQDLVAERVDTAAKQAAAAAKLLVESNARISSSLAKQNDVTQGKLKEIHTLVNSNLTAEMQNTLTAVEGQITLTKEVMRLTTQNGAQPAKESMISLTNLEGVAKGLRTSLSERGAAAAAAAAAAAE